MAETFEIIAARPEQRLGPGGTLLDVMVAEGESLPHRVPFTVEVPKTAGWRDEALRKAAEEAAEAESLFSA